MIGEAAFFVEQLVPFISLGTLIAGLAIFASLAGFRHQSGNYVPVLIVVSVAILSVGLDVAVNVVGGIFGNLSVSLQLARLQEIVNSGFLFAVPLLIASLLPDFGPLRRLCVVLSVIAFGIFLAVLVLAFAVPEWFVSVSGPRDIGLDSLSARVGTGERGWMFVIRDASLGVVLLLTFMIASVGVLLRRVKGPDMLVYAGVVIGVLFGMAALYSNFAGSYPGPLADVPFSRVNVSLTLFTLLAIAAYVQRYVGATRKLADTGKELARHRDRLAYLAYHNERSGMPNKQAALRDLDLVMRRGDTAIAGPAGSAPAGAALAESYLCRVEGIAEIEDSVGAEAAERIVSIVGERIANLAQRWGGRTAGVYHIEGVSFLVLIPVEMDMDTRTEMEEALDAEASAPVELDSQTLYVAAVIAHRIIHADDQDAEAVLRGLRRTLANADIMPGQVLRYAKDVHRAVSRNQELVQRLRQAIRAEDFAVHYQPIFDTDGKIVFAESLIRWTGAHPEQFIGLAEQSGLIVPITHYVIRTVCHDAVLLRRAHPDISVFLNVSARHITKLGLPQVLEESLLQHGLGRDAIGIEVTETSFAHDNGSMINTLKSVKKAGFSVAIDDFGTGYSSLSYVRELPADHLKIDRSFIDRLPASAADRALVDATVVLAHQLGKKVVAEGVETPEQRDAVVAHGVDYLQGFLFAKPMPAQDLAEFRVQA